MATNDINGSFGNNDASGLLMMTLAPNGDYGTNDINGDRGACELKNYAIGVHKNNGRMVPLATMVINVLILTLTQTSCHCLQWIIMVAIGHHWCHQPSLDIFTFTSPRNGTNGTI